MLFSGANIDVDVGIRVRVGISVIAGRDVLILRVLVAVRAVKHGRCRFMRKAIGMIRVVEVLVLVLILSVGTRSMRSRAGTSALEVGVVMMRCRLVWIEIRREILRLGLWAAVMLVRREVRGTGSIGSCVTIWRFCLRRRVRATMPDGGRSRERNAPFGSVRKGLPDREVPREAVII